MRKDFWAAYILFSGRAIKRAENSNDESVVSGTDLRIMKRHRDDK